MPEDKHKIGGMVLEKLSEAMKLIWEARNEMRRYYELSTGWSGGTLSEEERKEKKIKAYVNAEMALETAQEKLLTAMEMVAHEF